jgi:hypothetical protein
MDAMVQAVALTLAEASQVLDPPMTAAQLRTIVRALGWQPAGYRYTGRSGHPAATYSATRLLELHAALSPFNGG